MTRGAAVRLGASAFSWILFAFCFTLLLLVAASIVGLGGTTCATGGPFDVRTPCPDTSWLIMVPLPLAIGAIASGAYLGGGFGTPLTTWALPLTFLGFGVAFFIGAFAAGIGWGFIVCGALFLVMGAIALAVVLRNDPLRAIVGRVDIRGRRFAPAPRTRRGPVESEAPEASDAPDPTGALVPTVADGARSLLIAVAGGALGVVLAQLLVSAISGAG
ncbi:MAG TPA: hypothetical protein VGM38_03855 [Pseudolysinimonas sp.]